MGIGIGGTRNVQNHEHAHIEVFSVTVESENNQIASVWLNMHLAYTINLKHQYSKFREPQHVEDWVADSKWVESLYYFISIQLYIAPIHKKSPLMIIPTNAKHNVTGPQWKVNYCS